uniref:Uncharacterized protein n=1 Tax=Aegilops tauschii TaxID=37682 RepID=M8CZL9_AEGTA
MRTATRGGSDDGNDERRRREEGGASTATTTDGRVVSVAPRTASLAPAGYVLLAFIYALGIEQVWQNDIDLLKPSAGPEKLNSFLMPQIMCCLCVPSLHDVNLSSATAASTCALLNLVEGGGGDWWCEADPPQGLLHAATLSRRSLLAFAQAGADGADTPLISDGQRGDAGDEANTYWENYFCGESECDVFSRATVINQVMLGAFICNSTKSESISKPQVFFLQKFVFVHGQDIGHIELGLLSFFIFSKRSGVPLEKEEDSL